LTKIIPQLPALSMATPQVCNYAYSSSPTC
jgi:hypothetical protein